MLLSLKLPQFFLHRRPSIGWSYRDIPSWAMAKAPPGFGENPQRDDQRIEDSWTFWAPINGKIP